MFCMKWNNSASNPAWTTLNFMLFSVRERVFLFFGFWHSFLTMLFLSLVIILLSSCESESSAQQQTHNTFFVTVFNRLSLSQKKKHGVVFSQFSLTLKSPRWDCENVFNFSSCHPFSCVLVFHDRRHRKFSFALRSEIKFFVVEKKELLRAVEPVWKIKKRKIILCDFIWILGRSKMRKKMYKFHWFLRRWWQKRVINVWWMSQRRKKKLRIFPKKKNFPCAAFCICICVHEEEQIFFQLLFHCCSTMKNKLEYLSSVHFNFWFIIWFVVDIFNWILINELSWITGVSFINIYTYLYTPNIIDCVRKWNIQGHSPSFLIFHMKFSNILNFSSLFTPSTQTKHRNSMIFLQIYIHFCAIIANVSTHVKNDDEQRRRRKISFSCCFSHQTKTNYKK